MSPRLLGIACLAPAAAVFGAFWLLPMAWLVVLPAAKGWQTYLAVLTHPRYAASLANTVGLSLAVTMATLVLGAAVGLYLARTRFAGRRVLLSVLSLPLSFPGVIVGFFVILPARPRKPQDKAKVEVGVQVVERWIMARLRNRQFFSVAELDAAVAELLPALNTRPFKKLPGCRTDAFEKLDAPYLRALPAARFVMAAWKHAGVNIDYHVEYDGHYYSVPHALVRQQVERADDRPVITPSIEL